MPFLAQHNSRERGWIPEHEECRTHDAAGTDPVTGGRDGLLGRLSAWSRVPKIFFTNSSTEYRRGPCLLIHTEAEATRDISLSKRDAQPIEHGAIGVKQRQPCARESVGFQSNAGSPEQCHIWSSRIRRGLIARPIATPLLMAGILPIGAAAYPLLPVAPLPQVDFPTILVTTQLPGTSPVIMAFSVT
jgi:AcrB/AcrD/AcrF family